MESAPLATDGVADGSRAALADTVRDGFALTGGIHAVRQVAEFATSVVLARLLVPADFGVTAVVAGFLQVSYVVANLGMSAAVVQAASVSPVERDAAYTVSVLIGVVFTALFAILSPWAAGFFGMPVLHAVMPIMALQVFLAALSAIPIALLRRELRYGPLAVIEGGAAFVYAGVSIALAWGGYGVWSLVWAPLVSGTWAVATAHVLSGHRPRLRMIGSSVRRLAGYGGTLTVKNILVNAGRNGDNLVVAKLLGDTATGLYSRAFNFSTLPQTRLVSLLYGVCFPAFCRLRNDMDEFRNWYVKCTTGVAVVVTPLLLGLLVVADDLTHALLGEQWMGMVLSLRVLCLAALLNALHMLGGAAIEASGKLRYEVATEAMYAVLIPTGAIAGARFGIAGVGTAVLIAAVAMYVTKAFTVRAALGLPIRRYFAAALPSLLAGTVMVEAIYLARTAGFEHLGVAATDAWLRLGASMIVGVATYVAAMCLIRPAHLGLVTRQLARMATDRFQRSPVAVRASRAS